MQNETPWHKTLLSFLLGALLLVGVALFFWKVRTVLPPFIIAFVIAWLLDPLLDRMQRMGCSRGIAIAAVYALFLGLFVLGLVYLVPAIINQASQFAGDFPQYLQRSRDFAETFMQNHAALLERFKLPTTLQEVFARYGSQVSAKATTAVTAATTWIAGNVSKALWLILIPLVAFYFLSDIDRIRKRSILFVPVKWREQTAEIASKVGTVFSNYVRGLVILCILYGFVSTVALAIMRVDYAIILGLLAGILYAVPYIGAFSTVLIVFLVSLATHQPRGDYPVWMPVVYMLIQNQAFDTALTPKILGKAVGLHPVISIFALLAGGQLFGLAGMVLSVPIAASIQEIIFEFKPELRPEPTKRKAKPKPELKQKTKKTA